MPSIFTLTGSGETKPKKKARALGDDGERCKCVTNTKTGRRAKLCFDPKKKGNGAGKTRSGWLFTGKCT